MAHISRTSAGPKRARRVVATIGWLAIALPGYCASAPAGAAAPTVAGIETSRIDAQLLPLLAPSDNAQPREIDVLVDVPRLKPAPLDATVSTLDYSDSDRSAVLTLNGRQVSEAQMRSHADQVRAQINDDLRVQLAARQAEVDAAIARLGQPEAVVARSPSGFRLRLPQNRLADALGRLGGSVRAALLTPPVQLQYDMTDVTGNMGIADFATPYGMKGQGVGILHIEGNAPYGLRADLAGADIRYQGAIDWQPVTNAGYCHKDSECCSNQCDKRPGASLGRCKASGTTKTDCPNCWSTNPSPAACRSDIRGQEHSTMVSLMLHTVAPEATEYHVAPPVGCMTYPDAALEGNPRILVGSQSWSWLGQDLDLCEQEWDDFVTTSRIAHFHSAGNNPSVVVGFPASAYNVIAVGGYNPSNDTFWADDATHGSAHLNPTSGVEKPEILAPGANIPLDTGWTRSGTSIAAPLAAGFAADMMSGSAFFQNNPQAIKAYLIAGAHNMVGDAGFESGAGSRDGAGRIDYLDSYFYRWGKIWANGGNGAWFGSTEKIVETVTLDKGRHYTVAIAWLADGAYAKDHQALNMTMKLTLSKGTRKYEAYRPKNNFQLLDLVAPEGGNWTVTITRVYNSGDGGVNLALTVGEHD